jgi:hypothetical protein
MTMLAEDIAKAKQSAERLCFDIKQAYNCACAEDPKGESITHNGLTAYLDEAFHLARNLQEKLRKL